MRKDGIAPHALCLSQRVRKTTACSMLLRHQARRAAGGWRRGAQNGAAHIRKGVAVPASGFDALLGNGGAAAIRLAAFAVPLYRARMHGRKRHSARLTACGEDDASHITRAACPQRSEHQRRAMWTLNRSFHQATASRISGFAMTSRHLVAYLSRRRNARIH